MTDELKAVIDAVKDHEFSFCKFVSPNDAGETGAHQAGLYIPKNSIALFFDSPGIKGENKEKFAKIYWNDNTISDCRFIYYGQGSRNEYRITRLGKGFKIDDLVVIVKKSDEEYLGFILHDNLEKEAFLSEFGLNREDTNSLIPNGKEASPNFKPQARIILQLGDQLIRSESIAILEIIKNAYDACAKTVTISINNIDNPELAEIVIEDDGFGMDYKLIKDVWLHPGTTHKKIQIENPGFISPCNRIPLGEKGIGRFGAHKLGEEIELISKKKNYLETHLKINWKDFDNDDLLENIPINLIEKEPEYFTANKEGTKIIIKSLRTRWSRGSVRELYRAIISLNSPFEKLDSFKVLFKTNKPEWLTGLLSFRDIKDSALFVAKATISGNKITKLKYEFTPWSTMIDLKYREYSENNIEMAHRVYDELQKKKVFKDIDISDYKIGEVELTVLIFDLDTNVLSLGVQDKKGLKDYMRANGGMRVYRDGVRVYDYGEPGNDWLSLDLDRVNFSGSWISNNLIIGAIDLKRLESKDLVEKTNREGFVENDAFKEFYSAIRFTLSRIITQRNIDKDKLRGHYGNKPAKVPVVGALQTLREKVLGLPDNVVKSEILGMISEIEEDYKAISEVYIRSASAGLSLSIVIHEIEKIIQELLWIVESSKNTDGDSERIKSLTWHLGKLVDGYSSLIRRRSKKETDLIQVITNGLWNIEFRLKAHKVEIEKAYLNKKTFQTNVKCSDSLIIGTIVNIIDNSIWWMSYGKIQTKKLYIDVTNELPGFISLIIADNGPGFNLPAEEMIKPFISNKNDGGIGIGLHIANEIMNGHEGRLIFPPISQFTIPKEFHSGAIICLAFPIPKK